MALADLQRYKVIHRDIKMANILMQSSSRDVEDINYKLADFGLAHLSATGEEPRIKRVGTPSFMAPEVIDMTYADYGIDVWSLAIVVCFMMTKKHPFDISHLSS